MQEKTLELIRKFEREFGIRMSAAEILTYWIIFARIPQHLLARSRTAHAGKKYVSGPNEEGNVLVLQDPAVSDAFSVESWGRMETIDDFVKKALAHILADRNAPDKRLEDGWGTNCV